MQAKNDLSLHVHESDRSGLRADAEVRAMAVAVQANLALLRRLDARRRKIPIEEHDIKVEFPRHIERFRETLIDAATAAAYSEIELQLRLHEIWGEYCGLRWFYRCADDSPVDFSRLGKNCIPECSTSVEIKVAEVHAFLWRFRIEQDIRHAPNSVCGNTKSLLSQIPAKAYGKRVEDCTNEEILFASCELAGMLALFRWVIDPERIWGESGAMGVSDDPFQWSGLNEEGRQE